MSVTGHSFCTVSWLANATFRDVGNGYYGKPNSKPCCRFRQLLCALSYIILWDIVSAESPLPVSDDVATPQQSSRYIFFTPNIISPISQHLIPLLIFLAAQNPSLRSGLIHQSLISHQVLECYIISSVCYSEQLLFNNRAHPSLCSSSSKIVSHHQTAISPSYFHTVANCHAIKSCQFDRALQLPRSISICTTIYTIISK